MFTRKNTQDWDHFVIIQLLKIQNELLFYLIPDSEPNKKHLRKYIDDITKILKENDI